MRRVLIVLGVLGLALAGSGPVRAGQPTHARLKTAGVRWLPAGKVWMKRPALERRRQQLLDPARHTEALGELKQRPRVVGPQLRKAMYHAMLSTMRSDLPAGVRASLTRQLSRRFGQFARQVRRTPGMPVAARVDFGRVYYRFLRDGVLMQELAREREQSYRMARAVKLSGLGAPGGTGSSSTGAPPKIAWQVPKPLDPASLKPAPIRALTYSLSDFSRQTVTALQRYEKQARRWRLVQSHTFSPGFVARQKKALDQARDKLEKAVRHKSTSVPRITESKLLKAFVWPRSAVRASRIARDPGAVNVVDGSRLWTLNREGLSLRSVAGGLRLDATFETTIRNDAVLRAFKRSIETLWNGPVRIKGGGTRRLQTRVHLRRVDSDQQFSPGGLRLVEGPSNRAMRNQIQLGRSFSFTTPAHEFGHILGLRDTYKALYDPRARSFVEVQDRRTLMGNRGAPLSCELMTAACNNVAQR